MRARYYLTLWEGAKKYLQKALFFCGRNTLLNTEIQNFKVLQAGKMSVLLVCRLLVRRKSSWSVQI